MRIAIDLQGAQTNSRFRGIGRYSLSLALAMARNRGTHEILLVLNGLLPDTIEPIRAAFDGILPQENIHVWHAPGPVLASMDGNQWRQDIAECIRETFIASLQPDVVHVSSLFEGYADDAVVSIGRLGFSIPTAVTLYDLIPLLNADTYLKPSPNYERHYLRQIDSLKRANAWLAISDFSAAEGCQALQLPSDHTVNISAACDAVFHPQAVSDTHKKNLLGDLHITRRFVLYSGGADVRKNLPRLIRAYGLLPQSARAQHQLVLVGKMPAANVQELRQVAQSAGLADTDLVMPGYVPDQELALLYGLCTVFVLPSCHEGFGLPALEAMACGAAVIGSSSTSVPEVIGLADALFDPLDETAISARLQAVLCDPELRTKLVSHGLQQARLFSWDHSARKALAALEALHARGSTAVQRPEPDTLLPALVQTMAPLLPKRLVDAELLALAQCAAAIRVPLPQKQLLVDVSELARRDARSGVQRVTRSIVMELLKTPVPGYVVEPVYALPNQPGYRYASQFKARCLGQDSLAVDEPISHFSGDILLMLDLQHQVVMAQQHCLQSLQRDGVCIYFVVYDLLPIFMPHAFPAQTDAAHTAWLKILTRFAGAVCISAAVAQELATWQAAHGPDRLRPFNIHWFHLGADIENSSPTRGLPEEAADMLATLGRAPSFLMVGTVEPRKGQAQTLSAFELLWEQGLDVNLVIVGKCGWMVEELSHRLRKHPRLHRQLFWLEHVSDEYLEHLYAASSCLVAASEGEGFGLPLIEAAQHKLPIIARDIPVFREVAGTHAFFFSGLQAESLAQAVAHWLQLFAKGQHHDSSAMPWQTWKSSTQQLLSRILPEQADARAGQTSTP